MPTDSGSTATVDVPPPPPPVKSENQASADLQSSRVPPGSRAEPQGLEPRGLEPTAEFQQGLDNFKEAKAERQGDLDNQQSADLQSSRVPLDTPDTQVTPPDTQANLTERPQQTEQAEINADEDGRGGLPDKPSGMPDGPPVDGADGPSNEADGDEDLDKNSRTLPDEFHDGVSESPDRDGGDGPPDGSSNEGDDDLGLDKNSRTLPDEFYDDVENYSDADDHTAEPGSGRAEDGQTQLNQDGGDGPPDVPDEPSGMPDGPDGPPVDGADGPSNEADGDGDLDKNSRTPPDEFHDGVSEAPDSGNPENAVGDSPSDGGNSDRANSIDDSVDQPDSPEITPSELEGKTKDEIRQLAREKGLTPCGQPDTDGEPKKWKYPDTNTQALRVDPGHIDKETGQPYENPNAARPHVHGYDRDGNSLTGPAAGDKHIPLKG